MSLRSSAWGKFTMSRKSLSQLPFDDRACLGVDMYASLLQACDCLTDGKKMHQHIIKHGHGDNMFLGFFVLEMYGRCGAFENAVAWFADMPCRNICAWNYMIGLCSRHGQSSDSLAIFHQMLQEGMLVDKVTYITMISVCTALSSITEGKKIHVFVIGNGYESQVVVMTALVNLYGKCGDQRQALELFDGMPKRDTITWNALISGYKHHKRGREALQLFHQMHMEGVVSSRATFACTLSACSNQLSLRQGKTMHVYVLEAGIESELVISNALVRMYSQCGSLNDAQRLFDTLSNLNLVASNAMIAAYAQHGCLHEALRLLTRMQSEGINIDVITYMSMLDVCGTHMSLAEGRQIHAYIKQSGYEGEIIMGNALITMYGKCKSLFDARNVFDKMYEKDVVSWNSLISVYSQHGCCRICLYLFDQMQQAGMIPNNVTYVCVLESVMNEMDLSNVHWFSLRIILTGFSSDVMVATTFINMHGKTGSLIEACNIFDSVPDPNVISWTAMISSHSLHKHDEKALQLFRQMLQQGTIPDMVTFLNVIGSCTSLMNLNEGKFMHVHLNQFAFISDLPVANAFINMYGKCGDLLFAWDLFDRVPIRNLASWNVMIATCAQHGLGLEAFSLLKQMEQAEAVPDKVTFVAYLCACSHIGLLDEAIHCVNYLHRHEISTEPGIEHYDCILDMFGRAGQLGVAEILIDVMPFQPSALSWMTLLTTCRNLLDLEQGENTLRHIVELDSRDHVPYVMLANIYAAIGREQDAEMILSMVIGQRDLFSDENRNFRKCNYEEDSTDELVCHG